MEVDLVFKIEEGGGVNKIYSGEVFKRESSVSQATHFRTLIVARNSDEAIKKLKAYIAIENPSFDVDACALKVQVEYFII